MKHIITVHHLTRLFLFVTLLFAFSTLSQASPLAVSLSDQEMQSLQGKGGISGYVVYNGRPVAYATVSIKKLDPPYIYYSFYTGANGYYYAPLPNGCYAVTASGYGYSCTKKVCIKDNWIQINIDLAYCPVY